MKKCSFCNHPLEDSEISCPYCGSNEFSSISENQNPTVEAPKQEKNLPLYFILSCFLFPHGGLALYFIYKYKRPKVANICIIGFIVSIILSNVLSSMFSPSLVELLEELSSGNIPGLENYAVLVGLL